jgi:hypothetical protein
VETNFGHEADGFFSGKLCRFAVRGLAVAPVCFHYADVAGRLGEGIAIYRDASTRQPDDGRLLFRLGVALRVRYDLDNGKDSGFR